MRIKMKTLYVNEKKVVEVSKIGEFSEAEGRSLVNGGFGEAVDRAPQKAVKKAPLKMVKPKPVPTKKKAKK